MLTFKNNFLITAIILSSSLLVACGGPDEKDQAKEKEVFAIPVTVNEISRQAISSNFHTTTTLEARNEADIISRVTGIIEQLTVEEGDFVKKGQLLAKIDPRRYQLALNKANAELAGIKQELQRFNSMVQKKLVSEQSAAKLKFQYQAAIAARDLAALDLQDSQIIAPITGYISQRFVKPGHFTQGYQKLFHVVDQTNLQAIVYLQEHQLSNIKIAQQAQLKFSARQHKVYPAQVRSISPVIDSRTGTFKVILSLDNQQLELKPGMFAQLALTFETHHDALTVPSDAIITLDNNSKIFVIKENKAVEISITKGFIQESNTEIFGQLAVGDKIVVSGQHNLKADALVDILNQDDTSLVKAH